MTPVVLNIKHPGVRERLDAGDPALVYCGRGNKYYGRTESIWANPYTMGRDGNRAQVIAKYRAYIQTKPELMSRLPELKDKEALVCFCAPDRCHCEVLIELMNAPVTEPQATLFDLNSTLVAPPPNNRLWCISTLKNGWKCYYMRGVEDGDTKWAFAHDKQFKRPHLYRTYEGAKMIADQLEAGLNMVVRVEEWVYPNRKKK